MAFPDLDFDSMKDGQLMDLFEEVREAWQPRDDVIARATELRKQTWDVEVPHAWKQTAKTQHSSLPKEIAARVAGTMTLADPHYTRNEPDDDQQTVTNVNQVERFLQGLFQYFKRSAVPGKNSYLFAMDNLINKGAVCEGSIYAPHSWAGAPSFILDDKVDTQWWRDDKGRTVEDEDEVDYAASARAYMKQCDLYRRTARPPLVHRILPPEQTYPMFIEGNFPALFIARTASAVELAAGGFVVPKELQDSAHQFRGEDYLTNRSMDLVEVVTPNRIRYFWNHDPIKHKVYGTEGVVTNYHFIPFSYRVGLEAGELDYGHYGEPLLGLIDTQLRMIDTLLTYQHNAIHLASFPSFQVKYTVRDGQGTAEMIDQRTGRQVQSYQFKSGTIMDFGPNREIDAMTHPGMNKDFYEFLEFLMGEVQRVIPPTLSGQAASSGYNTNLASVQAKAIINPIADSMVLLREDVASMDLQHLRKRTPGAVYLNLELPQGMDSRPKRSERVKIDADMIGNYYQCHVVIDREIDRITLSGHLKNLGIVDEETILNAAGFTDSQEIMMRRLRDRVFENEEIQTALIGRVIKRYGLETLRDEAMAQGRIQYDANGMPLVRMPDGSMAGPGQRQGQSPQGQGGIGAMLGGSNLRALAGAENTNSTRNSGIALPARTATQRPRQRRRGGALPGGPQLQGQTRPRPANPAAP